MVNEYLILIAQRYNVSFDNIQYSLEALCPCSPHSNHMLCRGYGADILDVVIIGTRGEGFEAHQSLIM